MLNRRRTCTGALIGVVVLGALAGGCGTSLVVNDSDSILDLLSSFGITEDMTIADALNQLTVGDVVSAFVSFADEAASAAEMPSGRGLTDDQQAELESLQAQLDAGEISEAEFSDAVHEIIGDRGAGMPFAGFSFYGSPFGHRMDTVAAAQLDLTDEQQAAAEEIFQLAHDDIDALREAAHDEIRALLTEEQLAILDEMGMPAGEDAAFPMRRGPMGFGRHGGFGCGGFGPSHFADELQLTDEQQTAIDDIRATLRDAIRARHEQARDEFLGLLADEQLEILGWAVGDAG
jgi:Spy/CpxP family protein refolding chaperone